MIITLKGANFSQSNIGTLDSWFIAWSGSGLTAAAGNATSIKKDSTSTTTLTYTYNTENYEYTSGTVKDATGATVGSVSASNGTVTVIINAGNTIKGKITIAIVMEYIGVGEEPEPETPVIPPSGGTTTTTLPLVQGYIDKGMVNSELNTRVRSDGLAYGPFSVEVNSGYLIRAIYEHTKADLTDGGTAIVVSTDKKTSYSGGQAGKYYAFTFCKSDATKSLSPSESIIKSFSGTIVPIQQASGGGTTDTPAAGTDVTYTLVQGAHVQNDKELYVGPNRVTTDVAIKGKFTVTVNDGYAIRAVYEYTKASGDTAGTMVLETNASATTFTSTKANKYYGVTFTKAGDAANNNIAPTEAIVKSWKYV